MAAKRINPIFSRFGVGRDRVVKLKQIHPSMPSGIVEDVLWRDFDMPLGGHMVYVGLPRSTFAQRTFLGVMFCSVIASSLYIGFRSSQIHWPSLIAALGGQTLSTSQPSLQQSATISTVTTAAPKETVPVRAGTAGESATYSTPLPPRFGNGPDMNADIVSSPLNGLSEEPLSQVAQEEPISVELVAIVGKTVPQNSNPDDTVTLNRSDKSSSLNTKSR